MAILTFTISVVLPSGDKHHGPVDGFRWRSHEITRIEGFSDAVFGFAVTLLVVSLEVPRTSTELIATMRGFGAFVVTFMILAGMWYMQHTFFRRYGLEDRVTVVLNLLLLFTVLFFVYPLKFLFANVLLNPARLSGTIATAHGIERVVLPEHRPLIFMIFGTGFVAVFTVFILLYRHAYKQREELGLNEFEIYETRHSIRRMTLSVGVGLTYFAIAAQEAMPHRTADDKRRLLIVSVVILAILTALVVAVVRAWSERRRVSREWKSRGQAGFNVAPSAPSAEEIES
jgi:Endosomal/lysosomal potassium channel TMEM175